MARISGTSSRKLILKKPGALTQKKSKSKLNTARRSPVISIPHSKERVRFVGRNDYGFLKEATKEYLAYPIPPFRNGKKSLYQIMLEIGLPYGSFYIVKNTARNSIFGVLLFKKYPDISERVRFMNDSSRKRFDVWTGKDAINNIDYAAYMLGSFIGEDATRRPMTIYICSQIVKNKPSDKSRYKHSSQYILINEQQGQCMLCANEYPRSMYYYVVKILMELVGYDKAYLRNYIHKKEALPSFRRY